MQQLPQVAALPSLVLAGQPHVMLITSRDTGRWVIPKGWPKSDRLSHETALAEARQEAGLGGDIEAAPIGTYSYIKRLHTLAWVRCDVSVYVLHVDRQYCRWAEQHSRQQLWLRPQLAAERVRERDLAAIIQGFDARGHSYPPTAT